MSSAAAAMAETSCAQAASVPPQPSSLAADAQAAANAAHDDPTPPKLSSPDADEHGFSLLPDITASQSSSDLAHVHVTQQIDAPSKASFCRKVPKAKNRPKAAPRTEVAQPLAPALSAASHSLATIPLAPAMGAAYPFPPFATPNFLAHPFASLPMPAPRRAVRIAPMGVLPLPPPNATTLVADFHAASVVPDEPPRLHQLSKAKRRGSTVSIVIPEQALSPEERTRQKRMLRNRESAARSRDKRRNRNIQLQSSIQRYRDKKKAMDDALQELNVLCEAMRQTLERHNIPLPP